MQWIPLAVLSTDIVVMFTHILALVSLFSVKRNNVQGSQKLLLIALCMTELTFVVANFTEELCYIMKLQKAANALYIFLFAGVSTMYILIMFLITVDRFIVIYLNIKYDILWSPKKTMIVLSVLIIVSSISLALTYLIGLKKVERIRSLYVSPIIEAIFIVSASVIYFYIFKRVLQNRKKMKRLQQQLKVNTRTVCHTKRHNRFKMFVSTMIIITFVFFIVGANLVCLIVQVKDIKSNLKKISMVLLPAGFITDSLIYIFSLQSVRSILRRTVLSIFGRQFDIRNIRGTKVESINQ